MTEMGSKSRQGCEKGGPGVLRWPQGRQKGAQDGTKRTKFGPQEHFFCGNLLTICENVSKFGSKRGKRVKTLNEQNH